MIDVKKAISNTVKTGRVFFGANSAIETAKTGRAKLIIIATNCPQNIREDLEYYSSLSNTPIVSFNGSSRDLGAACGKTFIISTLTIRDPGESEILKLLEVDNV